MGDSHFGYYQNEISNFQFPIKSMNYPTLHFVTGGVSRWVSSFAASLHPHPVRWDIREVRIKKKFSKPKKIIEKIKILYLKLALTLRGRISDFGKALYRFYQKYSEVFLLEIRKRKTDKPITETLLNSLKRLGYYMRIWYMMSKNSFLMVLSQKKVLLIFLLGKVLRFIFFMTFLFFLVKGANRLAGYTVNQTIFFFLTFMVIDTTSQFFFREVYRFRPLLISGDFDLVLTKPISALFRVLMGGADVIDLITIPPLYAITIYFGSLLAPNAFQIYLYFTLLISGFLIATAFHIIVLSLGIITLEVDHTIMVYRDVTSMARFPVDIYKQPLRGVLTYLLPIGIMITLPAKAFMGLVTPFGIFVSISFGILTLYLAVRFWRVALQRYTSASS